MRFGAVVPPSRLTACALPFAPMTGAAFVPDAPVPVVGEPAVVVGGVPAAAGAASAAAAG